MRYCTRCIIPDTRPHIQFDVQGVCNACRAHASKPRIDWAQRQQAFREVVAHAKARSQGYVASALVSHVMAHIVTVL